MAGKAECIMNVREKSFDEKIMSVLDNFGR